MPTITDNLSLFKPDPGQSGVAAELNSNWDSLDHRFDEAGGHTHDGTPGQGPKVPVTSLATTGTPSATTYLRGDGLWTTGTGGGGGVTDHGALTGLTDDDHPQYANQSRGDTRYTQRANNLSDLANTATARTNLGAAAATHVHAGSDLTTGTVPTARLGSGTPSTTTFLRGDQTWAVPGAGGSVNLDDLADVLITSPADNQVLSYDAAGARWINEAAAGGGLTAEDVDDRVNALIVAGTGITKTYDDVANTLTLSAAAPAGPPTVVQAMTASYSATSTATVTLSATPTVGNLLVTIHQGAASGGIAVTTLSGHTRRSAAATQRLHVHTRVVAGGDGTGYTWTLGATAEADVTVLEIRGQTSDVPLGFSDAAAGVSGTAHSWPFTSAPQNSLRVAAWRFSAAPAFTPDGTWTIHNNGAAGGASNQVGVATKQTSAGEVNGPITGTTPSANTPNYTTFAIAGPAATMLARSAEPEGGAEGAYLAMSAAGSPMWAVAGGTTAERPSGAERVTYHRYFDSTLGKPITFDGTNWVDCTGTTV